MDILEKRLKKKRYGTAKDMDRANVFEKYASRLGIWHVFVIEFLRKWM